ncbi:MAG: branched-chain amino acid ABC transporter ATP-binding protein/permease [Acidimicrobiales bacterium]
MKALDGALSRQVIGSLVLFVVLVVGGLLYGAGGPPTRDLLVTQMLINAIMVIGLQIYIGNTGVLSFGHMGFAAIAGYTFMLFAMTTERKERLIPDAPFGLVDVSVSPFVATVIAVAVTLVVGFVVGLGLARSGARSGAVAATVITLALLFMVHEVGGSYADLTGGRNGLSFSVGRKLDDRLWIYIALVGAILLARLFKGSRTGRMAQAAREDDLAARAMGIDPARGQMIALLLSVLVVAVAASLRVFQLGTVAPSTFFFDYTLLTLVMLIVGGRNSVAGAVVGVALITAVNETTRYLAGDDFNAGPFDFILREGLTDIVLGVAMLGFMILRPQGLIEDWEVDRWLRKRFGRPEAAPEAPVERPARDELVLVADDLTVAFGGFTALDHAGLVADNKEIVGLIGPNGAGKTTLLNVVTGLVTPTSGSTLLGDVDLTGDDSYQIARAGLARTFQNLRLFPALSVRENVGIVQQVAQRYRHHDDAPTADELLVHVGLWEMRHRRARELDYGNARRLELARAAALSPAFVLLDEPTSGMSDTESLAMIDQVRALAGVVGAGVVVIDHDLGFITGICDRIYCLDQGRVVAEGSPTEVQADPIVQAAYLGTAVPRT